MRTQIDKELALFEAWIVENPSSRLFYRLAEIYGDLNREADAIVLLEKALNFHPQHIPARLLLADMYQAQNQPHKASEQLKQAALIVGEQWVVFSRLAESMPQAEARLNNLAKELKSVAGLLGQPSGDYQQLKPTELQKVLAKLENLRKAAGMRYS